VANPLTLASAEDLAKGRESNKALLSDILSIPQTAYSNAVGNVQQIGQFAKDMATDPQAREQFGQQFAAESKKPISPQDVQNAALSFAPGGIALASRQIPKSLTLAKAAEESKTITKKSTLAQTFPQFSENYPAVGKPVQLTDKKTGKPYPGKSPTQESIVLMAARNKAQKEIDAGLYNPYFDVQKRRDANPANYPLKADTMANGKPKKQATIDQWREKVQTEDARQRLQAAYDNGISSGLHGAWYKMGQLEEEFVKDLGPEIGRKAFKEKFADAMAATTAGADPKSNLIMAQYGNFLKQRGMSPPKAAYEMPAPIGGRYVAGNMEMYDKVINKGNELGIKQPKRHNFSANFMGHSEFATIDEQMTDLITPGLKAPPGDSYFAYEELVHEMAKRNGVEPRDFQDVVWGGKKSMSSGGVYLGKPMIEIVNEAIARTSKITGMSQAEIVKRGLIRSEIPLYSIGAAGVGLGAMVGSKDQNGT